MKSEIKKSNNKPFPKLMKHCSNKLIVLFRDDGIGFVVNDSDKKHPIGYYSNLWVTSNFIDFDGQIILSND